MTKAVIHSKLGGHCRVRTNEKVVVQNTLTETSKGENPNLLFSFVDAGKPIIKDKTKSNVLPAVQGLTLDFKTEKGKQYVLK